MSADGANRRMVMRIFTFRKAHSVFKFECRLLVAATGISPVLREVDVVGITNEECVAAYSALTIRESNICVSTLGGKSSCNVR